MSTLDCCRTSLTQLSPLQYRDNYDVGAKFFGAVALVYIFALTLFCTMNLVNNPNFSIFSDLHTSTQQFMVYGNMTLGIIFTIIALHCCQKRSFYDALFKERIKEVDHKILT